MSDVETILEQRGNRYGTFEGHAELSQALKNTMTMGRSYPQLKPFQRESLEMIQHKIARILNGDPDYDDSWVDIAGYAELVVKILRGEGI